MKISDLDKILNEALNKAMIGKNRIKQVNSNTIADFVNKHLEAINYSRCCKSDSELLPSKEEMNIKLYALSDELKTDYKQTERIYFESGFRYCQQVIKEHLQK